MTYKDNFVVEVKYNGKILRVKNDSVYLPFGSEYSLLLKNLNSRKASVKIHIDGQDVLDYSSLVLEPNTTIELEGFLSGNVAKNKFKFIQKTKEIQEHRGDKIDDGMIRVEFAFEKPKSEVRQIITEIHSHHHYDYIYPWWPSYTYYSSICENSGSNSSDTIGKSSGNLQEQDHCFMSSFNCLNNIEMSSVGVEAFTKPLQDEGITVKGSECSQSFRYASIGELEQSQVIILNLKGFTDLGNTIEKPVTVQEKLTCSSCGLKSKSSFKFCPNCGTFLE